MRKFVVPLIVVGAVGVGTVAGAVLGVPGLSGASTKDATTTQASSTAPGSGHRGGPRGELFDAAAKALHLTTDQLMQKLSDGKTTIADIAKQQGVDINSVIDQLAAADRQRIEDFVNNPLPSPRAGGRGNFGPAAGALFRPDLQALAAALGTTPQQLRSDLKSGKSIAQIAKDHNVDVSKVIDDLVNAADARIDQAVKNNKLTTQMAATLKSRVHDMITNLVNGQLPGPGIGKGFGFGRFGGRLGGFGAGPAPTHP